MKMDSDFLETRGCRINLPDQPTSQQPLLHCYGSLCGVVGCVQVLRAGRNRNFVRDV